MNIGDECPNCGSIMSIEEVDWGCFCCGYPDYDDEIENDDEDFISSDDCDDDDPNDSRNL